MNIANVRYFLQTYKNFKNYFAICCSVFIFFNLKAHYFVCKQVPFQFTVNTIAQRYLKTTNKCKHTLEYNCKLYL